MNAGLAFGADAPVPRLESRRRGFGGQEGQGRVLKGGRLTDDCHIGAEAFNRFSKSINAFIDQHVAA